jgi:hypothetical protein
MVNLTGKHQVDRPVVVEEDRAVGVGEGAERGNTNVPNAARVLLSNMLILRITLFIALVVPDGFWSRMRIRGEGTMEVVSVLLLLLMGVLVFMGFSIMTTFLRQRFRCSM